MSEKIRNIAAELSSDKTIILSLDDQSAKIPIKETFMFLSKFGQENSLLQARIMEMLAEDESANELQEKLSKMVLGLNAGPFNTTLTTSEMTRLILSIQVKLFSILSPEGWASSMGNDVFMPLMAGANGMVEVEGIRYEAESKLGIKLMSLQELEMINQLHSELQAIVQKLNDRTDG